MFNSINIIYDEQTELYGVVVNDQREFECLAKDEVIEVVSELLNEQA